MLLGCMACSTPPSTPTSASGQPKAQPDAAATIHGCLEDFQTNRLEQVLERCDASVKAHPNQPGPRSDRALVHSLRGDRQRACADVDEGLKLLARLPSGNDDPLLRQELTVRQAACRQQRTIDASD